MSDGNLNTVELVRLEAMDALAARVRATL